MVWYLGDTFMYNTFDKYYFRRSCTEYTSYVRDNFEVSGFMNNRYNALDRNMVSRVRNLLVNAITTKLYLPKMVVICLDDDLQRYIVRKSPDARIREYEIVLRWLMHEFEGIIEAHRDYLPKKSKHDLQPHFIWIEAPLHVEFRNNLERNDFNKSLQSVAKFHKSVSVLELKKIWDPDNRNFYVGESDRFTADGLLSYWEAVDRTVKYADTTIMKKAAGRDTPTAKKNAERFRSSKNQGKPEFSSPKFGKY